MAMKLHSEPLQKEWLDVYGHLNEAYYLVPFSNATWILQERFEIGMSYFKETGCAIYTVETHLRYLKEIRHPATLHVESMILGAAPNKIWLAHRMLVDDEECATGEFLTLHYDTREQRVKPMPEDAMKRLHRSIIKPLPDWVGRNIRPVSS